MKPFAQMSFVFRGTRSDIESGFPGYLPEQPSMVRLFRMHVSIHMFSFIFISFKTMDLVYYTHHADFFPFCLSVFMQLDQ